jgi:hypothetical protein
MISFWGANYGILLMFRTALSDVMEILCFDFGLYIGIISFFGPQFRRFGCYGDCYVSEY